jgi:hypothetical protein
LGQEGRGAFYTGLASMLTLRQAQGPHRLKTCLLFGVTRDAGNFATYVQSVF